MADPVGTADRIAELEAQLKDVANIMHHGGLLGKTYSDARRLLIPYWDSEECDRLQQARATGR